MAIDLSELGLTKEELQERVVNRIAELLLQEESLDEYGNPSIGSSSFGREIQKLVKDQLTASITALAEKHILPNVSQFVENLTLQETNKWGEKTGKSMTFVEYLTARAEAYLREEVNYEGKSKEEARDAYSWSKSQTRVAHLVNRHLHYTIEQAMKNAVKTANDVIAIGLEETVKIKLQEIAKSLKVSIASK